MAWARKMQDKIFNDLNRCIAMVKELNERNNEENNRNIEEKLRNSLIKPIDNKKENISIKPEEVEVQIVTDLEQKQKTKVEPSTTRIRKMVTRKVAPVNHPHKRRRLLKKREIPSDDNNDRASDLLLKTITNKNGDFSIKAGKITITVESSSDEGKSKKKSNSKKNALTIYAENPQNDTEEKTRGDVGLILTEIVKIRQQLDLMQNMR